MSILVVDFENVFLFVREPPTRSILAYAFHFPRPIGAFQFVTCLAELVFSVALVVPPSATSEASSGGRGGANGDSSDEDLQEMHDNRICERLILAKRIHGWLFDLTLRIKSGRSGLYVLTVPYSDLRSQGLYLTVYRKLNDSYT